MSSSNNNNPDSATPSLSNDEDTARRFHAIEALTSVYGFPTSVASDAIGAVGPTSIDDCIQYILDNELAPDQGGPVVPIENCPHIPSQLATVERAMLDHTPESIACCGPSADVKPPATGSSHQHSDKGVCGATGEIWICIHCGGTFCSRYLHGHALDHNNDCPEHSVYLSVMDLSIWCHNCAAYVTTHNHSGLKDVVQKLSEWKFGKENEVAPSV